MNCHKRLARQAFNAIGLDVELKSRSPQFNMLGLKEMNIRTILDVGANRGQFAQEMVKVFPDTQFICFEPLEEPYGLLSKWASTRGGRVKVRRCAIGAEDGTATMYRHIDHSPSSSFLKTTNICEESYPETSRQKSAVVEVRRLDTVVKELSREITPNVMIKVDVQGFEGMVIKGGESTFRNAKACLLEVALVKLYENQVEFKDLVESLDVMGYRYAGNFRQTCNAKGEVLYIDSLFIKKGD